MKVHLLRNKFRSKVVIALLLCFFSIVDVVFICPKIYKFNKSKDVWKQLEISSFESGIDDRIHKFYIPDYQMQLLNNNKNVFGNIVLVRSDDYFIVCPSNMGDGTFTVEIGSLKKELPVKTIHYDGLYPFSSISEILTSDTFFIGGLNEYINHAKLRYIEPKKVASTIVSGNTSVIELDMFMSRLNRYLLLIVIVRTIVILCCLYLFDKCRSVSLYKYYGRMKLLGNSCINTLMIILQDSFFISLPALCLYLIIERYVWILEWYFFCMFVPVVIYFSLRQRRVHR